METVVPVVSQEWAALAQEAPKVAEAISSVEKLTLTLPALDEKQKAIEVIKSTPEYISLGEVLTEILGSAKQGAAYLSPFEILVSRVSDFLKQARLKHVNRCAMIEMVIRGKLKVWERKVEEENKAAAAEQAKLDKKAEKTGEPAGRVVPNFSTAPISGYKKSVRYWVEVADRAKFMRAYRSDPKTWDDYLTINEQKLSAEWRESKDPKSFEHFTKAGLKLCKG